MHNVVRSDDNIEPNRTTGKFEVHIGSAAISMPFNSDISASARTVIIDLSDSMPVSPMPCTYEWPGVVTALCTRISRVRIRSARANACQVLVGVGSASGALYRPAARPAPGRSKCTRARAHLSRAPKCDMYLKWQLRLATGPCHVCRRRSASVCGGSEGARHLAEIRRQEAGLERLAVQRVFRPLCVVFCVALWRTTLGIARSNACCARR